MAVSVNWSTKVITIPKADTTLLQSSPTEIREYDLNTFRLELKALEAGEGMPFDDTHRHNPQVTVGGVILARVLEIINGYTITFEDGQYAVNIFGANSNVGDVINVNQVSIRSANSAGLINIDNVLASVRYQGFIYISANGSSGIAVGTNGTPSNPVDNVSDALTLANGAGVQGLRFLDGAWTLTSPLLDFDVVLDAAATLNLGGQNVDGSEFLGGTLTGTMTGTIEASESIIDGVNGFRGRARECGLENTTVLAAGESVLHGCFSVVAGGAAPRIDFVGAGRTCSVRMYSGGLDIINMADASNVGSADFTSGRCTIESSCTAGTLSVSGIVGPLTDNSTGTTVDLAGRIDPAAVSDIWQLLGLDPGAELVIDEPTGDGAPGAGSQAVGSITLTVTRENGGARVRVLRQ